MCGLGGVVVVVCCGLDVLFVVEEEDVMLFVVEELELEICKLCGLL